MVVLGYFNEANAPFPVTIVELFRVDIVVNGKKK
jgi:hypothetical protein